MAAFTSRGGRGDSTPNSPLPSPSSAPSLSRSISLSPISVSASASTTSLRATTLLRRAGSVKLRGDKISERLGSMRMRDSSRFRKRSKSNPQISSKPPPIPTAGLPISQPRHSWAPHRQDLPPWDRTVDAVYHKYTRGHTKKSAFQDVLTRFFKDHARQKPSSGYFRLPDPVRLRICRYLLPATNKPLCLNKSSFNRDVWRSEDFVPPSSTLRPLASYFEVSFAFRADILVAFLQGTRLHAVFSPYVGDKVSPLATVWLNKYGVYASNIVIEVDMSLLGCGAGPLAYKLLSNAEHTSRLLRAFAISQLKRSESLPMASLVLLCRRFYGQRPDLRQELTPGGHSRNTSNHSSRSTRTQKSEPSGTMRGIKLKSPGRKITMEQLLRQADAQSEPETAADFGPKISMRSASLPSGPLSRQYCPDSYLLICNQLLYLRGRVDSLRMCGFTEKYTTCFIQTLFPDVRVDPELHSYRVTPSTLWPKLSGQRSHVDMGEGYMAVDQHKLPGEVPPYLLRWEGCVQLPPPVVNEHGVSCLPPIVNDLQRQRSHVVRAGTSLSERTSEQMRKESGDSKKRSVWSWTMGKARLKKRTFSKGADTTM
ncbi:hypothetical protein FDECE_540 [Fusarium decemcellulare]|nr:hypothetical protein FDECE_540 [Fusarium decemcellulare]